MKTVDYFGGIIIIICVSLLWYRTGELESHLNTLAIATKHNVVTEQTDYNELLQRYKEERYRIDVLTEKSK